MCRLNVETHRCCQLASILGIAAVAIAATVAGLVLIPLRVLIEGHVHPVAQRHDQVRRYTLIWSALALSLPHRQRFPGQSHVLPDDFSSEVSLRVRTARTASPE